MTVSRAFFAPIRTCTGESVLCGAKVVCAVDDDDDLLIAPRKELDRDFVSLSDKNIILPRSNFEDVFFIGRIGKTKFRRWSHTHDAVFIKPYIIRLSSFKLHTVEMYRIYLSNLIERTKYYEKRKSDFDTDMNKNFHRG